MSTPHPPLAAARRAITRTRPGQYFDTWRRSAQELKQARLLRATLANARTAFLSRKTARKWKAMVRAGCNGVGWGLGRGGCRAPINACALVTGRCHR